MPSPQAIVHIVMQAPTNAWLFLMPNMQSGFVPDRMQAYDATTQMGRQQAADPFVSRRFVQVRPTSVQELSVAVQ